MMEGGISGFRPVVPDDKPDMLGKEHATNHPTTIHPITFAAFLI